jgi:anti-sigma B factor antagonist
MTETTTYPRLVVETVHGITVAGFMDEMLVSEEAIEAVSEQLAEIVDSARPAKMLLNFREVRCMSSSMLAVLLKLSRKMTALGAQLKLCGLAPDLYEIFKITRFDRIFEIHNEEWAALDTF